MAPPLGGSSSARTPAIASTALAPSPKASGIDAAADARQKASEQPSTPRSRLVNAQALDAKLAGGAAPDGKVLENEAASGDARCCHFSGHPIFCCRAEAAGALQRGNGGPPRHVVRLERTPGADRLGFGNVAAGPVSAPVLVISWIREGALAIWNEHAPEGMTVPPQSAIVSVNGVSADVQLMRAQLREQVIEMEVIAPDRWKYMKVVGST